MSSVKISKPVTSMCLSPKGDILFVGDVTCGVHVFSLSNIEANLATVKAHHLHTTRLSKAQKPITSLSFMMYNTGKHVKPCLLASSADNGLFLYKYVTK